MAPPPGTETPSSVGNDDKTKQTPQDKDDDKFRRVIQKRRKLLKDLRRRSTIKRKLIAKEVGGDIIVAVASGHGLHSLAL